MVANHLSHRGAARAKRAVLGPPCWARGILAAMATGSRGVGRSIALMNQKGGVGKTTSAVNIAAGLAGLGRRVLLIDMDPQAHASLHLGVELAPGETGVYDLLLEPTTPLARVAREVRPGLVLLPASTDLAGVETQLASAPDRLTRLRTALSQAREHFDFVIIDCPPSLGLLTLCALAAAREVIIPMQAHFLALQGVGKLLETVAVVNASVLAPIGAAPLRVAGVVLCVHDSVTSHAREVLADLEQFFESARGGTSAYAGARVYRPHVRRNIKLAECPSFGKHVFEYAPWCPGAMDYRQLAEVLSGELDELRAGRAAQPFAPRATSRAAEERPEETSDERPQERPQQRLENRPEVVVTALAEIDRAPSRTPGHA